MDTHELWKRLENTPDLPTMPSVAVRILELGEDPEVAPSQVIDAISCDPALAAKTLQAANSPLLSRAGRITRLSDAVMTLGVNGTLTIALSFALVRDCGKPTAQLDYPSFWRRSIVAASAARSIAYHERQRDLDTPMLAGLLQDIGMLALDAVLPQDYARLVHPTPDHETLRLTEAELLGLDHAAVGGWLLRRWGVPEHLCCAVAGSHGQGPEGEAPVGADPALLRTVTCSSRLADLWVGRAPETAAVQAAALASERLGWGGDEVAGFIETWSESVNELLRVHEARTIDPAEIASVLERARNVLVCRNLNLIQQASQECSRSQELEARKNSLEEQAERDPLTQLGNRRHLDRRLASLVAKANEADAPLTLALADIDHFKQVNDRYGHQRGDALLCEIASLLKAQVRAQDTIVRYGGEEFLLLLPGLSPREAGKLLERLRQAVAAHRHAPCPAEAAPVCTSISIGYAARPGQAGRAVTAYALLEAADAALYRAKREGRDCIRCAPPRDPGAG